jgi:hypothetical protein
MLITLLQNNKHPFRLHRLKLLSLSKGKATTASMLRETTQDTIVLTVVKDTQLLSTSKLFGKSNLKSTLLPIA